MKPFERLFNISCEKRIPLLCTFELTRRCNLRCRHCYLDHTSQSPELTTQQVYAVLAQLAEAGTLYLVLTGGEVFLRKDFLQICAEARRLSFDVRVFTNGTLITETIARKLASLHISGLDISLYGRKQTHEAITGKQGSFDASVAAVQLLRAHGVPVSVKAPLMRSNFSDRTWLKLFAARNGIRYAFDPTITARNNGDRSVLQYRLSERQLRKLYTEPDFTPTPPPDNTVADLSCSAGKNMIAICSDGTAYPCLQLPVSIGKITDKSLRYIWNRYQKKQTGLGSKTLYNPKLCQACSDAPYCQRCPGMALLEEGSLDAPSKIACAIAAIHRKILESPVKKAN